MTKPLRKAPKQFKKFTPSALLMMLACSQLPQDNLCPAITSSWQGFPSPDVWSNIARWNNGVPQATDDIADFPDIPFGPNYNISLDINATLGAITFSSVSEVYNINNDTIHTLTFNSTGPNPLITLTGNKELKISSPITVTSGQTLIVNVSNTSGNAFTFLGPVTADQITLTGFPTFGTTRFNGSDSNAINILQCDSGVVALARSPTVLTAQNLVVNGGFASFQNPDQLYDGVTAGNINLANGIVSFGSNQTINTFTYTGGTFQQIGDVTIQTQVNVGSGVTFPSSTTGNLILAPGAIVNFTGGVSQTGTVADPINLSAGTGTFHSNAAATLIVNQPISNGALKKTGSGNLNLSATNTYGGGTEVVAGNINCLATGAIPSSGIVNLSSSIANISMNDNISEIGNLTGATGATLTIGSSSSTTLAIGAEGSSQTYSGTIGGAGGIIKKGAGTLTFNAPLSYVSSTEIQAGTIKCGAVNTIPSASLVNLSFSGAIFDLNDNSQAIGNLTGVNGTSVTLGSNSSTTLSFGAGSDQDFYGIISGSGGILKYGSSTVTLHNANTYQGGTLISVGTLKLGVDNALPVTGTVNLNQNNVFPIPAATLDLNDSNQSLGNLAGVLNTFVTLGSVSTTTLTFGSDGGSSTFDGQISGAGRIVKAGTGTTVFGRANTYQGFTEIQAGTLAFSGTLAGNYLPATTLVNLNGAGAHLNVANSVNQVIGNLTGIAGTFVDNIAGTFTIGDSTSPPAFPGIISGSGNLVKTGTGNLTLTGANTYLGGTTINQGTLSVSSNAGLGNASGALTFGAPGGKLEITGNITGATRLIHLNNSGTIVTDTGVSAEFNGDIDQTVISTLTKEGDGTLILGGSNTYTGGTVINGGTLSVESTASLLSTSTVTLNNANSTLDVAVSSLTIGDLIGAGSNTFVSLGANTLTLNTQGTATYAGVIQSGISLGSILKTGTGNQTLSGTNTYLGTTTIEQGTLTISSNANLGNAAGALIFDSPGGTLHITSTLSSARPIHLHEDGIFNIDSSVNATFSNAIDETTSSALYKNGPGALILTGSNTYTGGTAINDGALVLKDAGTLDQNTIINIYNTGGSSSFDISQITPATGTTIGGLVGNAGTFVDLGAKTLTIKMGSFYSYSGIIQDSGNGSIVLDGGSGSVQIFTAANTYDGTTTINGGTLVITGNGTIGTTPLTLNDNGKDSRFDISGISPSSFSLPSVSGAINTSIYLGDRNLQINGTSSHAGVIQDATSGSLTVAGAGTVSLSGANTYHGGTVVQDSSTLAIVSPGSLLSTSPVTLNNTATFSITAGGNQSIGDLNGGAGTFVQLGANTLTINASGSDTYNGVISGNTGPQFGNVIVAGGGTLELTNTSSYSSTTVNGSLIIDGLVINPQGFTVSGTGFLGGSGGVNVGTNALTISSGGILSPGNSIGTFNITGDYIQSPGSILQIELGSAPTSDLVSVTSGDVTVTGSNLELTVLAPVFLGDSWTIVTVTGGTVIGSPFGSITSPSVLANFTATYNSNSIVISLGGFNPVVTVINQGNPGAVAACASSTKVPTDSDLGRILQSIVADTTDQLYYAFNQMQPSAFKGLAVSQQNIFLEVENSLTHRFMSFFPTTCEKETPMKRPTVWIDSFGSTLTQREKSVAPYSPQPSYTTRSFGILLGADSILTKNFAVGACTGYTRGLYSMHSNAGTGSVDSFYVGPYAKFGHENEEISPYLTASLLGEANWYDTNRHIIFDTTNRTARGSHTGQGLLFHVGGGAWIKAGYVDISPFANFDLIAMQENSYTESGAGGLNLHVHQSTYQFNEVEGGVLFRGCIKVPQGTIVPEISFSVVRETRNQGEDYTSSLEGSEGCSFVVEGYYPDRTLFIPAAELKGRFFQDRFTASLYYQGKFGDDFSQNELGFQFAWNF